MIKMPSIKIKRIASSIVKEISNTILLESQDKNFKNVNITGAEVTNDLSYAYVYFTTIDDKDLVLKELNEASSFFRKNISDNLELRHTPKIIFKYDDSIAYGDNIERIINKLHDNN